MSDPLELQAVTRCMTWELRAELESEQLILSTTGPALQPGNHLLLLLANKHLQVALGVVA